MKFTIAFSKVASNDLREATEWYEDKKKGLGIELLEEVKDKIKFIQENPLSFPIRFEESRSVSLKRFPYKIIFLVEEDIVRVMAIYHHKRDPEKWRREKWFLIALVFTLFVIPAMYSYLSRAKKVEEEVVVAEEKKEVVEVWHDP